MCSWQAWTWNERQQGCSNCARRKLCTFGTRWPRWSGSRWPSWKRHSRVSKPADELGNVLCALVWLGWDAVNPKISGERKSRQLTSVLQSWIGTGLFEPCPVQGVDGDLVGKSAGPTRGWFGLCALQRVYRLGHENRKQQTCTIGSDFCGVKFCLEVKWEIGNQPIRLANQLMPGCC